MAVRTSLRACGLVNKFATEVLNGNFSHVTRALHKSSRPPSICISPDNSTILCWHPEPEFPYEYTQPLPRAKTELEEGDSVLKIQYLVDEKLKNRPDGPTVPELSQLFHTPRITFRRRQRHEKKIDMKKYKPKDRDGL
ncbi:hypothetical protein BsWGS_13401 [Bradybaena similaris]